jgi:hypothetical protein
MDAVAKKGQIILNGVPIRPRPRPRLIKLATVDTDKHGFLNHAERKERRGGDTNYTRAF